MHYERGASTTVCCVREPIAKGAEGIMNALRSPSYWPQDARKWMAESIRNKEIEEVIAEMVTGSAQRGYHGLDRLDESQLEVVTNRLLLRKQEFETVAFKNLPKKQQYQSMC